MDDQREDLPDPERTLQRNRPKKLLVYNMPTDDVENTNGTNLGRDLLLIDKPQMFHEEQKGRRKRAKGTYHVVSH